jgi:predicted AlkP superfamily pyrophosphatase or phosphodiesterase
VDPINRRRSPWRGVRWISSVAAVVSALGCGAPQAQAPPARTNLVIVVDGLRPDYITAEVMPRLFGLGQRGIVFTAHHSVFPTVTG